MSDYSEKMPDMSQNPALAGKTVYSCGLNVTYDKDGYAVRTVNPNHPNYAGTTMSIKAQPIEDALAGKEWVEPSHEGLTEWGDGTGMPLRDAENGAIKE